MVETGVVLSSYQDVRRVADAYRKRGGPIFLDTETTGLNPRRDKLVTIQLYQEGAKQAVIIDYRNLPQRRLVAAELNDLFAGEKVVGHNLKFDVNFLTEAGIEVKRVFDTRIAQQVLVGQGVQEGVSYALKDVAGAYHQGLDLSKAERDWFWKVLPHSENAWTDPFPAEEIRYMALDVTVLPLVYTRQWDALEAKNLSLVFDLEMRVLPALAAMERRGIRIDREGWEAFIEEKRQEAERRGNDLLGELALGILEERLATYDAAEAIWLAWKAEYDFFVNDLRFWWETNGSDSYPVLEGEGYGAYKLRAAKAWKAAHQEPAKPKQDVSLPNMASSDQLLDGLRALGVPAASTDAKYLAKLEAEYPIVGRVMAYRKAEKFVDSFGESLMSQAEDEGEGVWAIHPEYNSIGAATGRMSCRRPNWQQVPSKGDGKRLRQCVIPRPGYKLVVCDFSNIELRILAAYSQDTALIGMFAEGMDLHSEMAYRMFGLDRAVDVKAETFHGVAYREVAKKLNYGLVYGMSYKRLAAELRILEKDAQGLMDAYFAQLPGVQKWLKAAGDFGARHGYARTMAQRVRNLDGRQGMGRVRRQAMNTPIQGTSADITKFAVAYYYEDDARYGELVAVVHDELVVEAPEGLADEEAVVLETHMHAAQRLLLGKKLPMEALPRPHAVVSDYWQH